MRALVAVVLCVTLASSGASADAAMRTSSAADGAVVSLPVGVNADYQLGGLRRPGKNVGIVARDRRAHPAKGRYNICYVNAFQTQPNERRLWRRHAALVLKKNGRRVRDPGWPDEFLLDYRSAAKRTKLLRVVGPWIDRCARDGFDAVEFDNLDSFSRSSGLLTAGQAKKYARLLVRRAHKAGLAAGQKNWATFNGSRIGFDFAVAESCARYRECGAYVKHYGRRVVAIEYRKRDFRRACSDYGAVIAVVLRDRALSPTGRRAWC